ncbi:MAG: leucine-rich repeat domain-containing protein [Bacteroidetes bacterium]|nr:leucine-rich repeat domain-containing protein [Bacteroidota bacterium]
MIKIRRYTLLLFLFYFSIVAQGQKINGYSSDQLVELSIKVEDQVRFLEFLLNTVGNSQTSPRDKDVIIRESYLKIFRDGKVQVEDDLVLDRKVVTNKDVAAYFKDLEFFYRNIEFKFKIREIKPGQKENGQVFFLVSLDRTLTATGLKGEKISNTKPRFIEVNLEEKSQELKIASIYTTKINRDDELKAWWTSLDPGWKSYFKSRFQLSKTDTVDLAKLYQFVAVDSLNLSRNLQIKHLRPLSELRDLKFLDISQTTIEDLSPISNITFLESLNLSNTPTSAIKFIKYSDRLWYLDISTTQIVDISELANLANLQVLKAAKTSIQSFAVLNQFKSLQELNLNESGFNNMENIKDLSSLKSLSLNKNYILNFSLLSKLPSLTRLDLSLTNFEDLSPLTSLTELVHLDITACKVSDLSPISSLTSLKKIDADETKLNPEEATLFVRNHPNILLIYHVKDLQSWWESLSISWKTVLIRINPLLEIDKPRIEILLETLKLSTLNLDDSAIESLMPVNRFVALTSLSISNNILIDNLLPLQEVKTLRQLVAKNTSVQDESGLKENVLLERIDLEGSPILSIAALSSLPKLTYLNVNASQVKEVEFPEFLQIRSDVSIIYRSDTLFNWWKGLDEGWKQVLSEKFKLTASPTTDELHQLTSMASLALESVPFTSLEPLTIFTNLRKLTIFDSPTLVLSPLSQLTKLTSLKLSQLPAINYSPIAGLVELVELDLSNTGVEELIALSKLTNLKKLNLSGTNIKSLKGIETLKKLEELDVASTNLRSLKALEDLVGLKKLTCFNTGLTSRIVNSFKESFPKCEVRFY